MWVNLARVVVGCLRPKRVCEWCIKAVYVVSLLLEYAYCCLVHVQVDKSWLVFAVSSMMLISCAPCLRYKVRHL